MQKKRLVSVLLVGALTFGSAVQVKADDLQRKGQRRPGRL